MKKTNTDIVTIFQQFQVSVLGKKPPHKQMYDDIRMMKFKVRPVAGDIGALDFDNNAFIETLWSLGKLDEFFSKTVNTLKKKDKQMFVRMFDDIYKGYQEKLNDVNLRAQSYKADFPFEVEIFREKMSKGN